MGFWDGLRRGLAGKTGPAAFRAAGKPLACTHCGAGRFKPVRAQLNTSFATFLGADWVDPSAYILECEACGLLHWFRKEPERVDEP